MAIKKRKITDAQEPNAGTDFHIMWAIQKCLELLNFKKDGLKSVAVESLDPSDTQEVDPDGDILLGVDLTEYYGNSKLQSACSVVISQLKYSTRHPDLEWTICKICTGKKGSTGSIIHRLATIYKGLIDKYSLGLVAEKVHVKLVSNRSISPGALLIVNKAKQIVKQHRIASTVAMVKKGLSARAKKEVDRLVQTSKLDGETFIQFLASLDFSDCGTGSRFIQRQNTLRAISELGAYDAKRQFDSLHSLVRSKTVPEAKGNNVIHKEDILLEFDFPDIDSMFPVPAKFEALKQLVEREQLTDITTIVKSASAPICLHGGAGIGKSTIVNSIPAMLPSASVSILFDCYGGGAYLDPDDKRHQHEKALLFISNELALKLGSPFLIKRGQNSDYYLTEFKRRLAIAAEILQKTDSQAILAIIIDAADNAVTAASQYHNTCFVHDLVHLQFPSNVRLILTTRTYRLNSLSLPDTYVDYPIKPFSEQETKKYLGFFFKYLSEKEIKEFKALTNGIPRVMSYALEGKGESLKEKMKPLKPGGKRLDDIFSKLIKDAEVKSGDKKSFKKVLVYLVTLPRPVPLKYLSKTTAVDGSFILDISTDLWKGLIYENEVFRFRDEDFETFLKQQFISNTSDFDQIASIFLSDALDDDYASTHLGYFLSFAERKSELREIVIGKKYLDRPKDTIRNREVFIERARLAMQFAKEEHNSVNFLKLQAVAAEASKTNKVLEEIMLSRPELASAFGNSQTNKKLYFQAGNPEWYGRVHLRSAAVLSRNASDHDQAKEHLKNAQSWLRYWSGLPVEERKKIHVNEQDLAFGAEAYLRTTGKDACLKWFNFWHPQFVFKSLEIFIKTLLSNSSPKEIESWFKDGNPRFDVKILINQVFFENGRIPPFDLKPILHKIHLLERIRSKVKIRLWQAVISLAEQMAHYDLPKTKIKKVLAIIKVENPEHVPSFYSGSYAFHDELPNLDIYFRATVLKSFLSGSQLDVGDLLPGRLRKINDKLAYKEKEFLIKEKKKFEAYYKHLLPIYQLRAECITKKINQRAVLKQTSLIIQAYDRDYDFGYRYHLDAKYIARFFALKLLDIVFFISKPTSFIDLVKNKLQSKQQDNIGLLLSMAERLSFTKKFQQDVLPLLTDADQQIQKSTLPGSTQLDHYSDATVIAARISHATAKFFFDKMVAASNEVDLEAHQQIKCINELIKNERDFKNPRLAFEFARFSEYCSVKLQGFDHFPWAEAVKGITQLDTLSSFSIFCRWDHRNVRKIEEHITEVLSVGIEKGTLGHIDASGLLPVNPYYWEGILPLLRALIDKYNEAGASDVKNRFVSDVIRDLQLNCSHVRTAHILTDFLALLQDGRFLKRETIEQFESYCKKVEVIGNQKNKVTDKPRPAKNIKRKINKKDYAGVNLGDPKSLEDLLHKKGIRKKEYRDFAVDEILSDVLQLVKPGQYVSHLDALVTISADLLDYWNFESALEQRLLKWSLYPEVKEWKQINFERVVKSRFFHYIRYDDYFQTYSLQKLADLFEIDQNELSRIVVSILPDYIMHLSAGSLYQLYEITAVGTNSDEKIEFLTWLLPRWNELVKRDFGDGLYNEELTLVGDCNYVVANFVRYLLGHPDKRIRWRAAHALLRLVNYGRKAVLDILLAEQDKTNCRPFQHFDHTFYWVASKLWLWVAIHKMTIQQPGLMKQYAPMFYEELMRQELPHAQMKLFVKKCCLQIEATFPGTYDPTQLSQIKGQLTNHLLKVERRNGRRYRIKSDRKLRFDFDSLDTLDHWYRPLGEIFGLSPYEVATIAEDYIFEKWGFKGNVRENDHVVSDDYELTRHYKNDISTIENLQTYYEYHALQCAAGELIRSRPLSSEDEAGEYGSWDYWLKDLGLVWDDFWLSDFKDPIPLNAKFWKDKGHDGNWEWNISRANLDEVAGFINAAYTGYLPIWSGSTIRYGSDYESQTVRSVLVTPQLAPSLLRSMQTIYRYDSHVPLEKEEEYDYDGEESNNSPVKSLKDKFRLRGWVQYINPEKEGIDESDADVYNLDKGRLIPGSEFCSWSGVKLSEDKRFSSTSNDFNDPITILQTWTNTKRKDRMGTSTEGQCLFMKKEKLLEFLQKTNHALLVRSEIYRRPETREYRQDYSYYTLYYIIYPNGKVETISGSFRLR